jgi:hypothetical protein
MPGSNILEPRITSDASIPSGNLGSLFPYTLAMKKVLGEPSIRYSILMLIIRVDHIYINIVYKMM